MRDVSRADRAIAELAAGQHGLVTTAQLLAASLTERMIGTRTRHGWLHRVHRGVYAVGHPPLTPEAWWLAAVLACGGGAALSHRSAAAAYGVRPSAASTIDVTAPGRRGRSRRGIRVHRPTLLAPVDVTVLGRIPITTLPRTIVDLGAVVGEGSLEYAIHRAESRRLLDLDALHELLARMPVNHRGAARVRAIVGGPLHALAARTRGPLERRFLRICRRHRVPLPRVNEWIALPIASGGLEVDFCWRERRLVVEIDEPLTHDTHRARRNDPARDRALIAAGWRPMRFPDTELERRPAGVAAEVLAALDRPDRPGPTLYPRPPLWRRRS